MHDNKAVHCQHDIFHCLLTCFHCGIAPRPTPIICLVEQDPDIPMGTFAPPPQPPTSNIPLVTSADLSPSTGCYKLISVTLYGGPAAAVR